MSERRAKHTHAHQYPEGHRTDGSSISARRLVFPFLVILAGLAAYSSSFGGVFLFDDTRHILTTQRIRHFWPPWELLGGRRPIVDLTLAVNFAISELDTWSYHALNLIVHVLAALTLYGVVRRTALRLTDAVTASRIALVAALLFVVHPLQTQSVTYIIQRGESLMGLFYLLTPYCVIRGTETAGNGGTARRGIVWFAAAVVACALGMGSKAVMVTAPLMVLLYDRTFLARSFGAALRERRGLYVGLAATWAVLGFCGVVAGVLNPSRELATVGFSYKGITPIDYALTQVGVLIHYLRLSVWPFPLCLDYEWPVAETIGAVALPAVIVVVLLVGGYSVYRRRPWVGFVVAWFFVVLVPTSSIVPIKDTLFEHRMYLSVAAVSVLSSAGAFAWLNRLASLLTIGTPARRLLASVLVTAAAGSLVYGTYRRNETYLSGPAMWSDVIAKRPTNARAYNNLGNARLDRGERAEAMQAFAVALHLRPSFAEAHNNLGKGFMAQGRLDLAIQSYRDALRVRPRFAEAHNNLGNALKEKGELEEALMHFDQAILLRPTYANAYNNRGLLYAHGLGDYQRAIEDYDQAIALNPLYAGTYYSRGLAYAEVRRFDRAIEDYDIAIARDPRLPEAYYGRGNAMAAIGRRESAIADFDRALALRPNYPKACYNRGLAYENLGRTAEAIAAYRRYIQIASPRDSQWIERARGKIRRLQGG